jgi:hypothetical protein
MLSGVLNDMENKILTLHPEPTKQGVRISQEKYDQVKAAILQALHGNVELTLGQLNQAVSDQLSGKFEGSIPWYVVTIKLDLEARGLLQRISGKQHRVRLRK